MPKQAIMLTLVMFLVSTGTALGDSHVSANPNRIDFGQVKQGDPVSVRFELRNDGPDAVMITFIDFSLPGSFAQVNPKIEAAGTVQAELRLSTENLDGQVDGEVTLLFDDPEKTQIVVTVEGFVTPRDD